MKAQLFDKSGKKLSDLDLPALFSTTPRSDIVSKLMESEKFILATPNAKDPESGKKNSASGRISHRRHVWGGHYGRGISRIPRKTMWRRGTQFFWVGAEISGTRGGRTAHPPKAFRRLRKINKKEVLLAFNSAIAATSNSDLIAKRYATLEKIDNVPRVLEEVPEKAKDFVLAIKSIFADAHSLVLKEKSVRAGKGKRRGRKYKSNAGLLLITSDSESVKSSRVDVRKISDLSISDLYPLGRLTLFTKKAIEQLGDKK